MKWLTLDRIKQQLRIEQDFHDEDDILDLYGDSAEEAILEVLNRSFEDIMFHGGIPPRQVPEVMGKSMAVIHTESFDKDARKAVLSSL